MICLFFINYPYFNIGDNFCLNKTTFETLNYFIHTWISLEISFQQIIDIFGHLYDSDLVE